MLTAGDQSGTYSFTYDGNRVMSQTDPWGLTLSFSYDADGNRTAVQDSLGGLTQSGYDGNNLVSRSFAGPNGAQLSFHLGYDATGRQVWVAPRYSDAAGTHPVGVTNFNYDAAGRLTAINHQQIGNGSIAVWDYRYDPAGRLTAATDVLTGAETDYNYDAAGQLLGAGPAGYSYDPAGNRTLPGYRTGPGNQLLSDGTWNYSYDNEGNLVHKIDPATGVVWDYGYDTDDRMTSAIESWNTDPGQGVVPQGTGGVQLEVDYTYDVFGNRLERRETDFQGGTGAGDTRFAYDGPNAWADLDGSNQLLARRVYLEGVDQLAARVDAGGAVSWYLTDRQGSVIGLTDASGALTDSIQYDAYGNVTGETNPSAGDRYKYTGRELDPATGLQYNRARYYDAATGRFLSMDPVGFDAGNTDLYRYVGNGPTNATDPSGMAPQWLNRFIDWLFGDPVVANANVYARGMPGGTPKETRGALQTVPEEAVGRAKAAADATEARLYAIDRAITDEPPPGQQSGPLAYGRGVATGVYDFSKDTAVGIANLPAAAFHLPETVDGLKNVIAEVRRGLSEGDLAALRAADPDLYQLVDLNKYLQLSDYRQGRLTARVTLRYALLIDGAAGATKLAGNLGKLTVTEGKALAAKIVEQVKKGGVSAPAAAARQTAPAAEGAADLAGAGRAADRAAGRAVVEAPRKPGLPERGPQEPEGVTMPKGGCFVGETLVVLAEEDGKFLQAAEAGVEGLEGWRVWSVLTALGVFLAGGVGWYAARRRNRQEEEMVADQPFAGKNPDGNGPKGMPEELVPPENSPLTSAETASRAEGLVRRVRDFRELPQPRTKGACLAGAKEGTSTPFLTARGGRVRALAGRAGPGERTRPRTGSMGKAWGWWGRCWLLGCLLLGSALLAQALPVPLFEAEAKVAPSAKPGGPYRTRRIEEIRVGDRVLAENPTDEQDRSLDPEVDPGTWRKIDLRAPKRDGSWAEVVLLRPILWLDERGARVGGTLEIKAPECGIDGHAEVLAIEPCPPIRSGMGRVVTGTYKHTSAKVIDLYVEGQGEPIGTTANHRFWSEDQEAFVPAEGLKPGERLKGISGNPRVTALEHTSGLATVFNLEVAGDHIYRVTGAGIIVHNATLDPKTTIEGVVGEGTKLEHIQIPANGKVPLPEAKGTTYFVVDRDSGRILKVGSTGWPNNASRMTTYQSWARAEASAWEGWQQRNLDLYYVQSTDDAGRSTAAKLESLYRAQLETRGETLPWDWKTKIKPKEVPLPREFGGTKTAPSLRDLQPFCR